MLAIELLEPKLGVRLEVLGLRENVWLDVISPTIDSYERAGIKRRFYVTGFPQNKKTTRQRKVLMGGYPAQCSWGFPK